MNFFQRRKRSSEAGWYAPLFSLQIVLSWMGIMAGMLVFAVPNVASVPFVFWGATIPVWSWAAYAIVFGVLQSYAAWYPEDKVCFAHRCIPLQLIASLTGVFSWALVFWSTVVADRVIQDGWHVIALVVYGFATAGWVWSLFRSPYIQCDDVANSEYHPMSENSCA